MLAGFIGAPCSGKSTLGAKLYAETKELGFQTELLLEEARRRIIFDKYYGHTPATGDGWQLSVLLKQYEAEAAYSSAHATGLVISDSSWLNSLLYTEDAPAAWALAQGQIRDRGLPEVRYDVLFWPEPIAPPPRHAADPGRLHSYTQSLALDAKVPGVLRLCGGTDAVRLQGSWRSKYSQAVKLINQKLLAV